MHPSKTEASLATEDPNNKRLSLGCVVVPEDFFFNVVLPTLGHVHGMIYVLPEDGPVQAMFNDPKADATVASSHRVNISAR